MLSAGGPLVKLYIIYNRIKKIVDKLMHYYLNLIGESPILHRNAASSLDTSSVTSRAITELARKRARTESEHTQLRELECQRSLWLSDDGRPMIPCAALRACIESAARRSKEGPGVRSGLVVDDTTFHFDVERYGDTLDEWGKRCQYTVPVVVQRNRILRTRARFETPWGLEAHLFAAEDLIAPERLREWLEFAGQRIGLGDWRPERSGSHGRFRVAALDPIGEREPGAEGG